MFGIIFIDVISIRSRIYQCNMEIKTSQIYTYRYLHRVGYVALRVIWSHLDRSRGWNWSTPIGLPRLNSSHGVEYGPNSDNVESMRGQRWGSLDTSRSWKSFGWPIVLLEWQESRCFYRQATLNRFLIRLHVPYGTFWEAVPPWSQGTVRCSSKKSCPHPDKARWENHWTEIAPIWCHGSRRQIGWLWRIGTRSMKGRIGTLTSSPSDWQTELADTISLTGDLVPPTALGSSLPICRPATPVLKCGYSWNIGFGTQRDCRHNRRGSVWQWESWERSRWPCEEMSLRWWDGGRVSLGHAPNETRCAQNWSAGTADRIRKGRSFQMRWASFPRI